MVLTNPTKREHGEIYFCVQCGQTFRSRASHGNHNCKAKPG